MDVKEKLHEAQTIPSAQEADEYFAQIRQQSQQPTKQIRQLTVEEERQMQDGFALEEMSKGAGWSIVADILLNMPKANVDPRGMVENDWKFAQLNAFWQGKVAQELQEAITGLIRQAHELQRIKLGEVQPTQKMRF